MIFFSLMNIIYGAVILLLERHLPAGVDLLCAHSAVIWNVGSFGNFWALILYKLTTIATTAWQVNRPCNGVTLTVYQINISLLTLVESNVCKEGIVEPIIPLLVITNVLMTAHVWHCKLLCHTTGAKLEFRRGKCSGKVPALRVKHKKILNFRPQYFNRLKPQFALPSIDMYICGS